MKKKARGLRSLKQRGLAKPVKRTFFWGETSVKTAITPKGKQKLATLRGLAPKQLAEARRRAQKYRKRLYYGHAELEALIRRFLGKKLSGKNVLEIGCVETKENVPSLLIHLARQGCVAYGLDVKKAEWPSGLTKNRRLMRRLHFQQGNVEELEKYFGGVKFDAIVSGLVFQTGDNFVSEQAKGKILRAMHKKLRKGGHFISVGLIGMRERYFAKEFFNKKDLEEHGFIVTVNTFLTPAEQPETGQLQLQVLVATKPSE